MLHLLVSRGARIHQSRVFLFKMKQEANGLLQVETIWVHGTQFNAKGANLTVRLCLVAGVWALHRGRKSLVTHWKGKPCNQSEKKAKRTKSLLKSLSSGPIKLRLTSLGVQKSGFCHNQPCREVRPLTMLIQCTICFLEVTSHIWNTEWSMRLTSLLHSRMLLYSWREQEVDFELFSFETIGIAQRSQRRDRENKQSEKEK